MVGMLDDAWSDDDDDDDEQMYFNVASSNRQHSEIIDCLKDKKGRLLELPLLLHMHTFNGEFLQF